MWALCVRKQKLSGHRESRIGSAVRADVLSGEWLVEGRESGKDMTRAGSEAKVIADAFSFCRCWILERFAELYTSPLFSNIS